MDYCALDVIPDEIAWFCVGAIIFLCALGIYVLIYVPHEYWVF